MFLKPTRMTSVDHVIKRAVFNPVDNEQMHSEHQERPDHDVMRINVGLQLKEALHALLEHEEAAKNAKHGARKHGDNLEPLIPEGVSGIRALTINPQRKHGDAKAGEVEDEQISERIHRHGAAVVADDVEQKDADRQEAAETHDTTRADFFFDEATDLVDQKFQDWPARASRRIQEKTVSHVHGLGFWNKDREVIMSPIKSILAISIINITNIRMSA